MVKVSDVYDYINSIAPVETKMDFDNAGHLVGNLEYAVSKILVSLDITGDVVNEAIEKGAELIVSHHPVVFSIKRVTSSDITGRKIVKLLEHKISAICMHTNLDSARGGVNDALAAAAGIISDPDVGAGLLSVDGQTPSGEPYSLGRIGQLKAPRKLPEYLKVLAAALKTDGLRYYDAGLDVHKIGLVCGRGGDKLELAFSKGCDTFISGDIKYDEFLTAKELGINVIDGGHFCTENAVVPVLAKKLSDRFKECEVCVSESHKQIPSFYHAE